MAWQTPKTNWSAADVPLPDDFNRIEGNVQELQNTVDAHKTESASDGVHGAGQANGLATLDSGGNVPESQLGNIPIASTSKRGIVQLSNSTTSTSQTTAATSYALKQVRDMFATRGYQFFTSNGTFTVPSGVTRVYITGCGGGGCGGAGQVVGTTGYRGGGGGGAASVFKHPCSVTPGQNIAITIGAGGSGSSGSGGQSGGTTSFGSILSISGGQGGRHASEGGYGGQGGSSPVTIFAGTSGNDGKSSGNGNPGRSCFVNYGNGSNGGYAYVPPENGQDGFLLIEW